MKICNFLQSKAYLIVNGSTKEELLMSKLVDIGCKIHDGVTNLITDSAPYPLNKIQPKTSRKPIWKCAYVGIVIVFIPLLIVFG